MSDYPAVRTLMGPGPSDIHPRVLQALARPTIGHLDPQFVALMDKVKVLLRYAFKTENPLTMAVSAPGSAGMETCFTNLMEPGDKVLVCINGVFGKRMLENVTRLGGIPVVLEFPWGEAVDPAKVEQALKADSEIAIVAFVHAETSTGVCSDPKPIADLARQHDCLTIVDTVTGLGGIELDVDGWGLDAVYSGSQKCLSCVPGLSPVTFNDRAIAKIKARTHPVPSWFLDLTLVMDYWLDSEGTGGKRAYHHTAPVNSIYALHESLVMLKNEGLENSWQRHAAMHQKLAQGLEALGLELIVDSSIRLPQLNLVKIPEGIDDAAFRKQLLEKYNLEIGAGLGAFAGKAWRIGLMGYAAREENIQLCLGAIKETLAEMRS
ncbi:pyridoxal-phosphate-dependent aminotransferase family protein [Pelagibaculum spongiae]|uniref:Alanine--glyoxylate aminotransferase n=1 Tax=Pelagibaculum spongiae TaxID=2080658 RepID=A0A2V1GSI0_9GAMM|nr:alanine--glyoxylate aminotransferase family protein [Pelagibaculum spongiae]PVZ66316.1 alanine--glyoxylate aminotransferase [Pelagibaculum spongiae]